VALGAQNDSPLIPMLRVLGKRPRHVADPELVALANAAIKSTDWNAYWRRADVGVARESDAYADARIRSREQMQGWVFK